MQTFNRKPQNKTQPPFPSNCNDLNELSYTLNGFHLVKVSGKNKIGVMFCNFEQESQRSQLPGIFL